MSGNREATGGGIGVLGVLGIVFVTLKLCGVINWSWWWVLLPFWGPVAVWVLCVAGLAILWWIAARGEKRMERYK